MRETASPFERHQRRRRTRKGGSSSSLLLPILLLLWYNEKSAVDAFVRLGHGSRLPNSQLCAASNRRKESSKKKKTKPRQKLLRTPTNGQRVSQERNVGPPKPRPDLTNYEFNRSPVVNEERLQASIGCEHFGSCSGCLVESHVGQVEVIQSAKLYFSSTAVRQHRLDVLEEGAPWATEETDDGFYQVVVPSKVQSWRTQAKLAVAPQSSPWSRDGCHFGLYQRYTHTVMPIPNCAVHHPAVNRAIQALETCTKRVGIAAFTEQTREGGLRYVQCQVVRSTGRICLTLVWHTSELKQAQPALSRLIKALQAEAPDLWHSIWCHCNDGLGNNIFHRNPRRWHRLVGPEFVREPLPAGDDGWLYFTPMAFRQGNMDGFGILATDVARAIPPNAKVCELYAGVGVLGLTALAYHAKHSEQPLQWIRCSDENPANPRCFQRSVESLPRSVTGPAKARSVESDEDEEAMTLADLTKLVEEGKNSLPSSEPLGPKMSYQVASAAQALRSGQALGANILIVDPPRKGLEDAVLDELCKPFQPNQPYVESSTLLSIPDGKVHWTNDLQTLIYVSCGFDALARDAERLLTSPAGWKLESATGYVLFPGSDHVETLCVFQRQ